MAAPTDIILTADQVERWKQRKDALQRTIADAQRELADINRRLDAVAILTGERVETERPAEPERPAPETPAQEPEEAMVDAITRIAHESQNPVPRSVLKDRLRSAGYAESRLGNYFYTAVSRLKQRNRIKVLPNGSITRPDDGAMQERETPAPTVHG